MHLSRFRAAHLSVLAVSLLVVAGCSSAKKDEAEGDKGNGAPAAVESPGVLSVIPSDVLAVVVVNNIEQAGDRIKSLGETMGAPDADVMKQLKQMGGEGIDWTGSVALTLVPQEEGTPGPPVSPVIYVPVTDFEKFVTTKNGEKKEDNIWQFTMGPSPSLAVEKEGYAVCTMPGGETHLKNALAAKEHLAADAKKHALWKSDDVDVAAIVTSKGIKKASAMGKLGIAIMEKQLEKSDDPNVKAAIGVFQAYKTMLDSVAAEVTYVTASVELEGRGGMRISSQALLKEGGAWAKAAAEAGSSKENLVAGLPAGDFVFAGGMKFSPAMMDGMLEFSLKMMKAMPQLYGKFTDEQLAKMTESWKDLMNIDSMGFVMRTPVEGESFLSSMAATMKVEGAEEYMKNYSKVMQEYVKMMPKDAPLMPKYTFKEIKVAERRGVQMDMEMVLPEGTPTDGLDVIFGPDKKFSAYIASANDNTIVASYESKERLESLIADAGKPGLADNSDIKKTRSLLPEEPCVVGYFSPAGAVKMAQYFASIANPDGPQIDLPEFPQTPPVGFAMRAAADRIESETVIPGEVLKALGEFIGKAQEIRPQPVRKTGAAKKG